MPPHFNANGGRRDYLFLFLEDPMANPLQENAPRFGKPRHAVENSSRLRKHFLGFFSLRTLLPRDRGSKGQSTPSGVHDSSETNHDEKGGMKPDTAVVFVMETSWWIQWPRIQFAPLHEPTRHPESTLKRKADIFSKI